MSEGCWERVGQERVEDVVDIVTGRLVNRRIGRMVWNGEDGIGRRLLVQVSGCALERFGVTEVSELRDGSSIVSTSGKEGPQNLRVGWNRGGGQWCVKRRFIDRFQPTRQFQRGREHEKQWNSLHCCAPLK